MSMEARDAAVLDEPLDQFKGYIAIVKTSDIPEEFANIDPVRLLGWRESPLFGGILYQWRDETDLPSTTLLDKLDSVAYWESLLASQYAPTARAQLAIIEEETLPHRFGMTLGEAKAIEAELEKFTAWLGANAKVLDVYHG